MPLIIILLVIIVLLLGGWWIIAAALGAVVLAIGAVLAGLIWFFKTTWVFLLIGLGLALALTVGGFIYEVVSRPTGRTAWPRTTEVRKASPDRALPPIVRRRSKPAPPPPDQHRRIAEWLERNRGRIPPERLQAAEEWLKEGPERK